MKKFIYLILACAFLASCKSGKFPSVDEITTQQDLKLSLGSKSIFYNGSSVSSAILDKALPYGNNELIFVSFREKSVYITDFSLNVKRKIYLLNQFKKVFDDRISDVYINKDTLYFTGNSLAIKKLSLKNEKVETINLKGMIYFSPSNYMSFTSSGNYVFTYNCFQNVAKDKIKAGDYVVGSMFSPTGNIVNYITVDKDVFEHDAIGKDKALYSEFSGKHYIYFEMEKNFLVLDSLNNKTGVKTFYVNKDWEKPQLKNKQLAAYMVNTQNLIEYNGGFIHWPPPGNFEKKGRIIIYDKDFQPVKKVYLPELAKISFYSYFVCGNKLIVFSGNRNGDAGIYIYNL